MELRARHPPDPRRRRHRRPRRGGAGAGSRRRSTGAATRPPSAATDGRYIATSVGFDAGWGAAAAGSETPDFLALSLDRETYRPGDTARARVVVPNAGQASSSRSWATGWSKAERSPSRLGDRGRPAGRRGLGAGAYVTATLIRPMDVAAGRNPARAIELPGRRSIPGRDGFRWPSRAPTRRGRGRRRRRCCGSTGSPGARAPSPRSRRSTSASST